MTPSLFNSTEPDPVGTLLDTGYQRFTAFNGLEGLAKFTTHRLDVLAVLNPTNTRGLLRDFISEAKRKYQTICVWEVWNECLREALVRYGFTPETEIDPDGKANHGFRWDLNHRAMAGEERCPTCGQKLP